MPYARKIILHAPSWDSPLLEGFIETCLRDNVSLVCVVGDDCERVHDVIDEIVVGDGAATSRYLTTTWHADETIADVQAFAEAWTVEGDEQAKVEEVVLVLGVLVQKS
jgi:hypothetical protein